MQGTVTPPNRVLGHEVLLSYGRHDPGVWHAAIIMGWVGGDYVGEDVAVIVTPDIDLYPLAAPLAT